MLTALLLVLMGALGFYLADWISSTGLAYWRAGVGFAVAFMVSWVGGVGMSALVFAVTGTVNTGAATASLLGKLFWWALFCSGYGIYKGRAKFGPKVKAENIKLKKGAQPSVRAASGNESYAEALAEIEEGRLDKGVWARSFAEAGGDEPKAKALYIKARAGAMKGAEVWENTQPPESSDAGIKATVEKATVELDNPAPVSTPKWPMWIVAGALPVFVIVSFSFSAYQSYTSRQVVVGTETESQPTPQATPAPQVDWSQYTPANEKILKVQETKRSENLVPFNGKLDDAPRDARSATAQSDYDKALKEHFRLIDVAHPDIATVLASAGFQAWLVKYPAYERIVVNGTAPEVIGMLNTYKKQNQLPGAAAQAPNAFYKCNGPSGVLYQATPCGTASN